MAGMSLTSRAQYAPSARFETTGAGTSFPVEISVILHFILTGRPGNPTIN